jgi:tetratricopeptide (TPR) repeat protein
VTAKTKARNGEGGRVFLSYSRRDSDYAVLLYAWLAEHFGSEQIFWDREGIDVGEDYRRVLTETLQSCEALVAVIGPDWFPSPWIQREIRTALTNRALVVPVLVGRSEMPKPGELPRGLGRLTTSQAQELSDLRFRERLLRVLQSVVQPAPQRREHNSLLTVRLRRLLLGQSDRQQRLGLEQLAAGSVDESIETLEEVFEILMTLFQLSPGDTSIELRLGYVYKDLAQNFQERAPQRAQRYIACGREIFERLTALKLPVNDLAGAFNGLGNIFAITRELGRAEECCRKAVTLVPSYGHAWNDLFLIYQLLAERGDVRLPQMREALRQLRRTARGEQMLLEDVKRHVATLKVLTERNV